MQPSNNKDEIQKFNGLLNSMGPDHVYFVTGKNGAGKSRFFAYATKEMAHHHPHLFGARHADRLLCLSGTMHDKYPPNIYKSTISDEGVVYLGNKVNNNMISDIAPFRRLCHYMLSSILEERDSYATQALQRLNFEDRVVFKFRYGKSRKTEVFGALPPKLELKLSNSDRDSVTIDLYRKHLLAGDFLLADMEFFRNGKNYGLTDLSSGEKQYALALLGFVYCGSPGCIVYYDEPENSLHPSWQLSIVKDLAEISEILHPRSTIIVATHSPLIASSVRNGRAFVCDLPAGQAWQRSGLHGRGSDTVLREQFHLYSARSPEVGAVINRCLHHIALNETGSPQFQEVQNQLREYDLDLASDDPAYEVVATILRF